jgi:uncharacterized membrane protein
MTKSRLEAFSDGVIAIIITIMVLEIKVPHGSDWAALRPLIPVFLAYVLSFALLGIYWNNHHHMLQAAKRVNARILWANLHLLFWLSLFPVVTHWVGENHAAPVPVALYAGVQLAAAVAYFMLARALVRHHGADSALEAALGRDDKGRVSVAFYAAAAGLAFVSTWISIALIVVVAVMWLVPDRRIERALADRQDAPLA